MDFLTTARELMEIQEKFPGTTIQESDMWASPRLMVEIPVTQEFIDMWRAARKMFEPAD